MSVVVAVFRTGGLVFDFVSCTSTVKVDELLVLLGFPEMEPLLVPSLSPFGSVGEPGAIRQW